MGPLYLQVLSLGLIWTSLHCSGMCGPLLAGLGFGRRGAHCSALLAMGDVLLYQSGRAVIYAGAGAAVGFAGAAVAASIRQWTPVITLIAAVVVAGAALRGWWRQRHQSPPPTGQSRLVAATGHLAACLAAYPRIRALVLGALLAGLPCMLPLWVLSLAATSGSALHGAGLMVLLVVLTIPVLLIAVIIPLTIGRLRRASAPWIGRAALSGSACWLLLIALAGFEIVPHAHLALGGYVVMFW